MIRNYLKTAFRSLQKNKGVYRNKRVRACFGPGHLFADRFLRV